MKIVHYIVLLLLEVTNSYGFTECQMGTFGENCSGRCHCKNTTDCRKHDGYCINGCAFGWKGFNCSEDLNLIRRIRAEVTTSQSSIYSPNNNPQDFISDKAIDEIQNYSVKTCKCCSVTYGNSPSWWQIDLAQKYLIGALQIFGRAKGSREQLEHAVVYAWNISVGSHMTVNMTKIYEIPRITTSQIFTKQLDPIVARFFVVKLFQKVLTLCEFKLFEKECVNGKFGNGCMRNCHCSDNKTCNQITGKCDTPGCLLGWQGDSCETECQMGNFGENCSGRCHCKNTTDCRKHDGYCINGCAFGWKGFNCSEDLNLIRRIRAEVTTNQSSIFSPYNNPQDFNSDKAIDEIQNYSVDTCKCCSVTYGNFSSWWQIDLAQKYLIGALQIFGLADSRHNKQLEHAVVYAWNTSVGSHMTVNMTKIYEIPTITTSQIFTKQLDPIVARFFEVKLLQPVLTLCEFKLFEKECVIGKFGNGCMRNCHCSDNKTCNQITGKCCTPGCLPGWQGDSCETECVIGKFGNGCMRNCHCSDNKTCNQITGKCGTPGCLPGWQGDLCETVCNAGKFGDECNQTCNCFNGSSCVNTNGTCYIQQCEPGWLLPSCSEICHNRNFGDDCNNTCHCKDETNCNHISGLCDTGLCEPGWLLPTCSKGCGHRTFGDNCSSICHCFKDTSCDAVSGKCDLGRCDPGWISCDKKCDHRKFGANCSSKCHCRNNARCNTITGKCFIGLCDSGWQGTRCDQICSYQRFGFNCSSTCHCKGNTSCNEATGACNISGDCNPGWEGSSCSEESRLRAEKSSGSAAAIGGGIGATAALVILGSVFGFFLFRRMRSSRNNAKKETKFSHLDKALKDRKSPRSTIQNANVNRSYEVEQERTNNSTNGDDYYSFGEEYMGIRIHELWDYIHSKLENNSEQLISEFKTLPQGLVYSYKSADHISNRGKNRYKEMYAYDHTRVILADDGNPVEESKTDYINACYIDGYEKVKKFVASQGPTKNMVEDFWRMIWQLKSDKIVMLTNLIEMGKTKCLLYWPKDDEETECSFGNYVIHLLETKTYLDFNIRVLEVKQKGENSRRIHQYHFKSWPDKDVPDSTWCLVNFWRAVDTTAVTTAGPIVVHCSAGVGRTGTFIALDNIVNQAHKEGCVRPLQVVKYLRTQRVNMVQTKEQYVYLHEAVADALYFGTHIIWTRQFGDVLAFMLQKDKDVNQIRLQIQFRLIEKSVEGSVSDVAENPEYSNVEMIMSESDAYKPKIKNRGFKYVQQLSAMFIPNYKGKNTFIVSKSPDKDTMEEFWSLVDEQNIKTAIMLTEQLSTCYQSSCELESSSNGRSRFYVNKIEEKKRKGYTQRTFTFKESNREEEEYLTTVKQFEYTAWKDGYPVPRDTASLLDMIDTVLKWQPHLSESQPVLVYCSDGFSRSGVVCVLMNELQRMKYEGHINIVESVKMMKKRQRGLIGNYEQYRFCFDLINDHIKPTDVYQNL